ncbi:MAG: DUF2782 domain-containing protein [Betaproteobacteria bacterium]
MRKIYQKLGLLLVFMALQLPLTTLAQPPDAVVPPAGLQPLEDIPPPIISGEDQVTGEPQVTIVKKAGETVEEYRINGQLYMLKVTPAHGVPYYMHKEDQSGGWLMDGPTQPLSIPKWTLFRF